MLNKNVLPDYIFIFNDKETRSRCSEAKMNAK